MLRTCSTVVSSCDRPSKREELALQRHQYGMRGGHRIHGQKIERRRAIDQHIGQALFLGLAALLFGEGGQRFLEAEGAVRARGDFEFETQQIERRGRDGEAGDAGFRRTA